MIRRPVFPFGLDPALITALNLFIDQVVQDQEISATSAPTTGFWRVGTRVWSTTPIPGGFMGWVCTAEGTPGTWKVFGPVGT